MKLLEIAEYVLKECEPEQMWRDYRDRFIDNKLYFPLSIGKYPMISHVMITENIFGFSISVRIIDSNFKDKFHYEKVRFNKNFKSLYKSALVVSKNKRLDFEKQLKQKKYDDLANAFNNLKECNAK